jgi:DNA-directed RNA polymerase subunit RPC12/RpoP
MSAKEYKCPACGGAVRLDIASQKLRCFFCAVEYEAWALEERSEDFATPAEADDAELFDVAAPASDEELFDAELFDVAAPDDGGDFFDVAVPASESGGLAFLRNAWENPEAAGISAGDCPSCGAVFWGGKMALAAATCPCCGNARIVQKRLPGLLKPGRVIPFKYDKSDAAAALAEFCKDKRLLPDSFRPGGYTDGFRGVYAPFWLVDALAEGDVWYDAVKYVGSGKYRRVEHDDVRRVGSASFEKIPVDASEKMDNDYMDAIEPFYFSEMEEFNPSRFAGSGRVAVACDADDKACASRAKMRIEETIAEELEEFVIGYDKVTVDVSIARIISGKATLCLFPVWTLNAAHDDEKYPFMMNGQTGKSVGELPVDEGKAWKYRALFTALFCPVAAMLLYIANRYLNTGLFYLLSLPVWFLVILSPFIKISGKSSFDVENAGTTVKIVGSLIAITCAFAAIATTGPLVSAVLIIIVSVIFSALAGFAIVHKWKAGMNTVKPDAGAYNYMVPGSLVLGAVKRS